MPLRSRLLVPTLALLTTITSVVSSLGAPLVPAIAQDAGVSLGTAQWTLTISLLVGAVSTPIMGRLGGNQHRRTVILVGLLAATFGCLLAALPTGFVGLVTGRALQGFGIGLTPLAIAVIREFVSPPRLSSTVALLSVTTVAGAGLGYPLTAWVAEGFGVPAAFWLGFAVCAVTLLLALLVVPRSRSGHVDHVDWLGALLLAVGTGALLLAVSQGDPWGWLSARVLALAIGAGVLLGLWVHRTLRVEHPLVDLRLATLRGTIGANVTAVTAGVATYILLTLVVVSVQAPRDTGFGLDASVTTAGLLLVPYSVMSVLGSRFGLALMHRVGAPVTLPTGCVLYLVATLMLVRWHQEVWQLLVVMAVAGIGSGCTFAAMPGLIVRAVPPTETGSATSFNHVLRYLGFSAGSALALALLEVFSDDGRLVDRSFTATTLVAAAIWLGTAVVTLLLARAPRAQQGARRSRS
jgi:predicted MFS family arabinose efflux permease